MDNEKDLAIIGSKGKGGGGSSYRAPVEEPDTLQSTQIVTIVDAISEGPIEGLVDDDKGIALNYTPLRTPDGTLTYQNVSWDSRLGTPDQEAYTDIAGAEAEQSVGVEVTNLFPKKIGPGSGSVTRTLDNTNCTHVRITLMVQGLYEQKTNQENAGDVVAATVGYSIQITNKNGAVIAGTSESKTDKTTSSAQWCLKFALDRNGPWNITVTKTTEDSDKSALKNDLYWSSYTEIIGYPLVYPHTATVLLRGSAETFGGSVPSRAYHVKGLKIQVPSNYNPETRDYSGIWDGTFKMAWTDNPAWVLRDLVQSPRYGLSKFFPPARQGAELIDKWTLYQLAQYCDQLVPDGENGSEPRYTFNAQIMGSGEAREVIQSIASVFHGMTYWSSGMIFARADMPTDPVKLISHANVIDGLLTYSTGSAQERHSVALVTWYDPDDYGRARVEPVYDWDAYTRYGYRPVQVTAYGCTSRGQAYRQGLWTLLTEDEQWQCTVEVGLDCYDLLPGDFVKVADPTAMGVRYTGRIKSVSGKTVVLDAPVTLAQNETYELGIVMPDGMEEKRTVVTRGTTDTLTVSTAYSHTPVESALWVISGTDAAPRLFAVRSITEKSGDSAALELSLREVHLSKYAQLEGSLVLPDTPGRITKSSLALPSGLNVTETTYTSNGLPIQRLTFSWAATGDPEASQYEPQYKAPNGQWTNFQAQRSFSIEVPVAAPGNYLFRVRSVATDNRTSDWAEITYRSTGTTATPKTVTNLTAQGGLNCVIVSWTMPQDSLTGYYEVWMSEVSENVATSVLVAKIYGDTFTVSGLNASTPYWFWVRSVSVTGVLSAFVGPAPAMTEALPVPEVPDGLITRPKLDDVLNSYIDTSIVIENIEAANEVLNAVDNFNERIENDSGFAEVSQKIKTEIDNVNGAVAIMQTRLQSNIDSANALIQEDRQTIAKNDYAMSKRVDTVQATVSNNTAAIQTNTTAISDLDRNKASASSVSTLATQVGENTTAVQINADAIAGLEEDCEAKYVVKVNANKKVAGFGLWSSTTASEFAILADKFKVVGNNNTSYPVFSVDTQTGAVGIVGNLFVLGAKNAGSGWITGDYINANSVITLNNGSIVIDGTNGTIKVLDPSNTSNGTYTFISNGYVNQYVGGLLTRSLSNVETGTCSNNTWKTLSGKFVEQPKIIVSPKNLQSYNSSYANQSQSFVCDVTSIESTGTNTWRFKPVANLSIASGTTAIPGPASINTTMTTSESPKTFETATVQTGANTTQITGILSLAAAVYRYESWEPLQDPWGYVYPGGHYYHYYNASITARLAYKLTSSSSWSYSSWTTAQTLPYNQTYDTSISQSVATGNYDVKAQIKVTAGSVSHSEQQVPISNSAAMSSLTLTKGAATILATGTLNYIAVGR